MEILTTPGGDAIPAVLIQEESSSSSVAEAPLWEKPLLSSPRKTRMLSASWLKGILVSGDVLAVVVSGLVTQCVIGGEVRLLPMMVVSVGLVLSLYVAEAYDSSVYRGHEGLPTRVLVAWGLAVLFAGAAAFVGSGFGLTRNLSGAWFGLLLVTLMLWRLAGASAIRSRVLPRRVAVVGSGPAARDLIRAFSETDTHDLALIVATEPESASVVERGADRVARRSIDDLPQILAEQDIDLVAVALPPRGRRSLFHALVECRYLGIEVQDIATCFELLTRRLPVKYLEDGWVAFSSRFLGWSPGLEQKVKRAMDVGLSVLGLVGGAPVMGLIAVGIRLTSPGPIVYRQKRVGLNGHTYVLYKFRSMRADAEGGRAVWAAEDDPRVTPFGSFLRKTHLDELPQLWNVLKGDMSLVGPRPERPEFVALLREKIPYYGLRHMVKPGVTGWAQVCYPYGASEEDALRKLEYDLYYIRHKNLLWDVRILLRTVTVAVLRKGSR